MGVPGEAAERGRLTNHPRAALGVVLLAAVLSYIFTPLPAPAVPAPTAADCIELRLYSNGYHSDIGVPASVFPADHPLRELYPQAESFLIGWGDEKFYRSDGTNLWAGLDALIPPSRSVMHVSWNAAESSAYLGPNDDTIVTLSSAGAERFVRFVDRALVLDEAGAATRVADGKVIGRSSFLRTKGSFHLFNVCNQWMGRALRAAGLDVNARAAWLAGPLIRQVRQANRAACPSAESSLTGPQRWS